MQEKGKEMGNLACHNIGGREGKKERQRKRREGRHIQREIMLEGLQKSPPLALTLHLVVTCVGLGEGEEISIK